MKQVIPMDSALGIIFALAGAAILQQALNMNTLPGMNVGPGLFPSIVGGGMAIMGAALTVQGWLERNLPEGDAPPLVTWFAAGVLAALIAVIVVMPHLGFLVAGTVFAATIVRMSGGNWVTALIFSPVATALIYFTFTELMRVPLPSGILG